MARQNGTATQEIMELLMQTGVSENMAQCFQMLINEAMKMERTAYLQASPYERNVDRIDQSNGFKSKTLHTRIGDLELTVPQTRNGGFYPSVIQKGVRSERALLTTIAEMYIQGVSTRKVTKILEELCDCQVSSSQVSRIVQSLDGDLEAWRNRPLGHFSHLMVDARYEKVRYGHEIRDCAVLWGIGIRNDGQREILGVNVAFSEAEIHWREFFSSLVSRGLIGVTYIVSDDHVGLTNALKSVFPGVTWNRCHTHLARNVQDHVSKSLNKVPVAQDIRTILQATDLETAQFLLNRFADRWVKNEPKLVHWAQINIPQGFQALSLHPKLRRSLRTSNLIERFNREIKRRSRVVRIFPNMDSCLRLVSAVLIEFNDDWSTGRRLFSV
jgi:transposase-like protein